jgi:hypothetical protein
MKLDTEKKWFGGELTRFVVARIEFVSTCKIDTLQSSLFIVSNILLLSKGPIAVRNMREICCTKDTVDTVREGACETGNGEASLD